jgi:hypothetical protein
MKKLLTSLLVMAVVGIATVGLVASEYGEENEAHEREHEGKLDRDETGEHTEQGGGTGAAYLSDPALGLYENECGSCHMAYPPPLLPAASWQLMMSSLGDHFGDNAELDTATAGQISGFLARNAAGDGRGRYAEGTWRSTRGRALPLRITETDRLLPGAASRDSRPDGGGEPGHRQLRPL